MTPLLLSIDWNKTIEDILYAVVTIFLALCWFGNPFRKRGDSE